MAPKKSESSKETKPKKAAGEKRQPSPFIVFCSEKRPEVKKANPDASFGDLGKLLGAQWKSLTDAQKAAYKK